MDELCQFVSRIINIDAEREKYTKMYDYVRNAVIDSLRQDEYFNELFCDLKLCGSYADNLKVSKPNEFDLVVCLKLPFNELVKIIPDNAHRGNVLINITEVLKRLEQEKRDKIFKFLEKMVNPKKYLLQDKFQSWLEGCVTKFFSKTKNELQYTDGSILRLHYRKQGPAHTVEVINGKYEFSVDFVPGFLFESSLFRVSKREVTSKYWQAIPKPMSTRDNPSFRTSFTDSERTIFANQNQFKNTLRMMKKFRDVKPNMVNLKSYYIKSLFLWHDEWSKANDPGFWNKPTIEILHVMFGKLETALQTQTILFFWDKKLNMLETLSKTQIESMYHEVVAARKILMQPRGNFASIFLTKEEQIEYMENVPSETVVMDELCQQISRVINGDANRTVNYKPYEFMRNALIKNLKENECFSMLFHELKLSGGASDFKVVLCFKLPFNGLVKITPDNVNRGNILINITEVLKRLEQEKMDKIYKFLEKMVNPKKYLLQDKFQSWLEGCVTRFFSKTNNDLQYTDGSILHLQHRKQGPAHVVKVINGNHEFSVDFVPAFLFESSKFRISKREVTSMYWQAIPKPMGIRDNPSFGTSFEESEQSIYAKKNQFKNALRMMNKFRDNKPKMVNLDRYNIKTLFLWHDEWATVNDPGFWNKPTIKILHVMFEKLVAALEKQELPFFWDHKHNLLKKLSRSQVESMYQEARNARYILMHPESKQQFLSIFLNDAEISQNKNQFKDEAICQDKTQSKTVAIAQNKTVAITQDKTVAIAQDKTVAISRVHRAPRAPLTFRHEEEYEQEDEPVQEEVGTLSNTFAKLGILAVGAIAGFVAYKAVTNRNRNTS